GNGGGGVPPVRPVQVVRDGREAPRAHQRGEEADPERRFLLGAALLLARHPCGSLHARDRGRPHRGLDGQYHRAVRRQSPDPPPRRLHRPLTPRLGSRRQALRWARVSPRNSSRAISSPASPSPANKPPSPPLTPSYPTPPPHSPR